MRINNLVFILMFLMCFPRANGSVFIPFLNNIAISLYSTSAIISTKARIAPLQLMVILMVECFFFAEELLLYLQSQIARAPFRGHHPPHPQSFTTTHTENKHRINYSKNRKFRPPSKKNWGRSARWAGGHRGAHPDPFSDPQNFPDLRGTWGRSANGADGEKEEKGVVGLFRGPCDRRSRSLPQSSRCRSSSWPNAFRRAPRASPGCKWCTAGTNGQRIICSIFL